MRTNLKTIRGLLAILAMATPAAAQGTYVSASLVGDIARFSHAETDGGADFSGSGEALGFALRLGTPIGSTWGVEAEFARPAEITQEGQPLFLPLASSGFSWSSSTIVPGATGPTLLSPIDIFPFGYTVRTSHRTTTFSTSAWVRQTFTNRIALVYLGGMAFVRTTQRTEASFLPRLTPFPELGLLPTILPPRSTTEFVDYGVRPLAGVDARIGLAEHVELVPSVRLTGLQNGWLIRPSIGLGWTF
jgi:hypothetical protein